MGSIPNEAKGASTALSFLFSHSAYTDVDLRFKHGRAQLTLLTRGSSLPSRRVMHLVFLFSLPFPIITKHRGVVFLRRPLEIVLSDESRDLFPNPVLWSVWTDEDYIGRISRLSRRCPGRLTCLRVMTRSLMQYKRHFEKNKQRG